MILHTRDEREPVRDRRLEIGIEWWLVLVPVGAVFLPLLLVWLIALLFGVPFF
jgi:hypothetical protein